MATLLLKLHEVYIVSKHESYCCCDIQNDDFIMHAMNTICQHHAAPWLEMGKTYQTRKSDRLGQT